MKRILLTLSFVTLVTVSAQAQTQAIGARLGVNTIEASYQKTLSSDTFVEVDLGLDTYSDITGVLGELMFNTSLFKPSFTQQGAWDIYTGFGLALGNVYDESLSTFVYRHPYYGTRETLPDRWGKGFMIGVPVQVGISYTLPSLPVKCSLDLRPTLGLHHFERIHPDSDKTGLVGLYGAGIRCCYYPRLSILYIL